MFKEIPTWRLAFAGAATPAGILLALMVALPTGALAFGPGDGGVGGDAYVGHPEGERAGEELFGRNCQQCHNTRGHGGKCPQLVRGAWGPGGANSDRFMFETISNGRPNTQMGAFGKAMSAPEIWQIVAYLRAEAKRVAAAEGARKNDPEGDLWY
ncbi:MAG: cytochrome c [Rhodocyclaceae bacterium]|nr:cytochrome c [Rhodocyclaceae bacterium]